MAQRMCKIEGCNGAVYARELCNKHYQRAYSRARAGKPFSAEDRPTTHIGERYGRLVVIGKAQPGRRGPGGPCPRFLCRCDCGSLPEAFGHDLRKGHVKSCGCLVVERARKNKRPGANRTHGRSKTGTYRSWLAMTRRCRNAHTPDYRYYGGRGITVCDRWLGPDGFENFLADMGERPAGLTIDRIDVNGAYSPDNCRWAT